MRDGDAYGGLRQAESLMKLGRYCGCFGLKRMKVRTGNKQSARLTVSGALLLLASVAIFIVLILPWKHGKEKAPRVKCTAGLKQVVLGYLLWANEHEGKLPMEVSVSEGGSREDALAGRIVPNFTVVAREISDPRVLRCPSDKRRGQTITFGNLSTNHISYFLNVDAASLNQEQIIAGDRDITINGSPVRPGLLPIVDPSAVGWGKTLHGGGGNIALVDGSVHQTTSRQFGRILEIGVTNRLIIP